MSEADMKHIKMLAEDDFEGACSWAFNNVTSLRSFFDTWSEHCGSPKSVFIGQTVAMIISND